MVARNDKGEILCSRTIIHTTVCSAFASEAIACRSAVEMGKDMGWVDVIIEGDSLSVIKKCQNQPQDCSLIGAYIADIKDLQHGFHRNRFSFTPRSANSLTHHLATESLKRGEEAYLLGRLPAFVDRQMTGEWARERD